MSSEMTFSADSLYANTTMDILIQIFFPIFGIAISLLLILRPIPLMKFIGTIYWHLGKATALGKSEETKKFFIGENPFWPRVLGTIMLILSCLFILARVGEKSSH